MKELRLLRAGAGFGVVCVECWVLGVGVTSPESFRT